MLNQILSNLNYKQQVNHQQCSDNSNLLPASLRSFLRPASGSKDNSQLPTSIEAETQGYLASWFSQAEHDPLMPKGMSRKQRLVGFLICLFVASLCYCLAMAFLPIIATPVGVRKFVLLHTFGSLLLIGSFSFLLGPLNHVKGLFKLERLFFTFSFLFSLIFGLYSVIVWKSAVLAFTSLILQILLVLRQVIISVPGGKAGLIALIRGGIWTLKGMSMSLPV